MKSAIPVALLLLDISMSLGQAREIERSPAPLASGVVTNSVAATNEIAFVEFLSEVATSNLDYAAQRYNVSVAEAAIAAAREFQNPTLQLNGGRDVTHGGSQRMPDTYGASLMQEIELGGKRRYRILGARHNFAAASATLDDFLRNLKLDAAAAFADALALARNSEQKRESARFLSDLLEQQRERFHAGDISSADVLQTQVEEEQFRNRVLSADSDAENASVALSGFLGRDRGQTRLVPKGNLDLPPRELNLSTLLADALQQRPDLVALRHARDAAETRILEETAKRVQNVDVGAGWAHSSSSQNSIAPSPDFDSVGLSFSVPLPLWNRNKAAIASSRFTAAQAHKQLEAAELKTEVQIRQAFNTWRSSQERVKQYRGGILKDADEVLEAKRFSYQRGQSTLLELLDAQRTANEVRSSYQEALADQARALIEVQRAGGLLDLQF